MSKRTKTTKELIGDTKAVVPEGPRCLKCGAEKGWSGPHYQKGRRIEVNKPRTATSFGTSIIETIESLVYTCNQCGFERHEPCKDIQ
jgi:hypothetical protein